ncbi:ribose 5-phosphate isomerase A-domain-containing protein, partial [Pyronema domesticum]
KRLAALAAIRECFPSIPPKLVGIGSGSTIVHLVQAIQALPPAQIKTTTFIPTSYQSLQLLLDNNLRVSSIDHVQGDLDIVFDGCDQVDPERNCVKGGGGCLLLEKVVAVRGGRFVVVADHTKEVPQLSGTVPVEVIPLAAAYVLEKLGGRVRQGAPGKLGPVVTDQGGFIIDVPWVDGMGVKEMAERLKNTVGVVEHGIFWEGDRRAERVYVAGPEGVKSF